MGHHSCCNQQKVKRGLWSPEEDEKLIRYISTHGYGCWSEVPEKAGLKRCGKSCRLRWINYLRPDIRRGRFTPEEEKLIISLHEVVGNRWAHIASHLPGRTDNEIKNYWNSWIKKKINKKIRKSSPQNNNHNYNNNQTGSTCTPFFDHNSINFASTINSTLNPEINFVNQNNNNSRMTFASAKSLPLQETLVSSSAPLFMFDISGPPPLINTIIEEANMDGLGNEANWDLNQHQFQAFPISSSSSSMAFSNNCFSTSKARTSTTNVMDSNGYGNLPPLMESMEMDQLHGWVEEEEAQHPFAIGSSCYFSFWEQADGTHLSVEQGGASSNHPSHMPPNLLSSHYSSSFNSPAQGLFDHVSS